MKELPYLLIFILTLLIYSPRIKAQNINSKIRYLNAYGYGIDKVGKEVSLNSLTFKDIQDDAKIYIKHQDPDNKVTYKIRDNILEMVIVKTTSKSTADNIIRNLIKDHGNPIAENATNMTWVTPSTSCMLIVQEDTYFFVVSLK